VRSRFAAPLIAFYALAAMPAATFAADGKVEKPAGHDYTLDTIFVIAVGIPAILAILSLIDIAVSRRSRAH
jgi:hypothetical protein